MKKIWMFLVLCVIIVAILPIIGNKIVKEQITITKANLNSYGLEISTNKMKSNYLQTIANYKISIRNTKKFLTYFNTYSDTNIAYDDRLRDIFKGMEIFANVTYSNIPISDDIKISFWVDSLPINMMQNLQKKDKKFHNYLTKFIQDKKIFYHVNYNVINNEFNGYLEDIDEEYISKNNTKITFKIIEFINKGKGDLLNPKNLRTNVGTMILALKDKEENLNFELNNISTYLDYKTENSYVSQADFKKLTLNFINKQQETYTLNIDDLYMNSLIDVTQNKGNIHTKLSFRGIDANSNDFFFKAKSFKYDLNLSQLDKKSLIALRDLLSDTRLQNSSVKQNKIQNSVVKFLSKGFILHISELSLGKLNFNNTKEIDGFKCALKISLKNNPNLKSDLRTNPRIIAQSISFNSTLKFSKEFFALVNKKIPLNIKIKKLAKKDGKNLVYKVEFKDETLSINAKKIN